MLSAAVFACLIANCAVGGHSPPSFIGTSAQSPSAQMLLVPSTINAESTLSRPRSLGNVSVSTSGFGDDGTVEIIVLVGIRVPSARIASTPVAASNLVLRQTS